MQTNAQCTSCRSRKMLKNEDLRAKIGVDTAENEPDVDVWSNGLLVLLMLSAANRMLRTQRRWSAQLRNQQAKRGGNPEALVGREGGVQEVPNRYLTVRCTAGSTLACYTSRCRTRWVYIQHNRPVHWIRITYVLDGFRHFEIWVFRYLKAMKEKGWQNLWNSVGSAVVSSRNEEIVRDSAKIKRKSAIIVPRQNSINVAWTVKFWKRRSS